MAKVRKATKLSTKFGINKQALKKLGVLDPTIDVDTPLFIDPTLFKASKQPEFNDQARRILDSYFALLLKVLKVENDTSGKAAKAAAQMISYHEIKGTCLGYSASSVGGSGFGEKLSANLVASAKAVIQLGVNDPDLFLVLPLFEENIGADRISDMMTNIVFQAIADFNIRILKALNLKGETFKFSTGDYRFLVNPFESSRTPIILLPTDILADLPVAVDYDSAITAARENEALRLKIGKQVGEIWSVRTRREKALARQIVFASKERFEEFLNYIKSSSKKPYDIETDPEGLLFWHDLLDTLSEKFPFEIAKPKQIDIEELKRVVHAILEQFKHLIEDRGLSSELWVGSNSRPESAAQKLFFAVAYSYCKSNNLDITPEAETGRGPVDFKFSSGGDAKVIVEIKLSTNSRLISGYKNQLSIYQKAEKAEAIYLVLDIGRFLRKSRELNVIVGQQAKAGLKANKIFVVDGHKKLSASKVH